VIVHDGEPADGDGENTRKFLEPNLDPFSALYRPFAEQESASDAAGDAVIPTGYGKPAQLDTPLVTEVCESHVTVIDPGHPLFGRTLKSLGLTGPPGRARYCRVEVLPGQPGYILVASTNLSTEPRPEPTVLTLAAVEELVATFLNWRNGRRSNHATRTQPASLDAPGGRRTQRRHRGDRPGPHGGRGK
jgi:hypothetical protein